MRFLSDILPGISHGGRVQVFYNMLCKFYFIVRCKIPIYYTSILVSCLYFLFFSILYIYHISILISCFFFLFFNISYNIVFCHSDSWCFLSFCFILCLTISALHYFFLLIVLFYLFVSFCFTSFSSPFILHGTCHLYLSLHFCFFKLFPSSLYFPLFIRLLLAPLLPLLPLPFPVLSFLFIFVPSLSPLPLYGIAQPSILPFLFFIFFPPPLRPLPLLPLSSSSISNIFLPFPPSPLSTLSSSSFSPFHFLLIPFSPSPHSPLPLYSITILHPPLSPPPPHHHHPPSHPPSSSTSSSISESFQSGM